MHVFIYCYIKGRMYISKNPYLGKIWPEMCVKHLLRSKIYACPYKMPKLERGISLTKLIRFLFSKVYLVILLFSPNKLTKFQDPRSNSYQDILLTRKAWQMDGQMDKLTDGQNYGWTIQKQYALPTSSNSKLGEQIASQTFLHLIHETLDHVAANINGI